jgi:hypothetical protein
MLNNFLILVAIPAVMGGLSETSGSLFTMPTLCCYLVHFKGHKAALEVRAEVACSITEQWRLLQPLRM